MCGRYSLKADIAQLAMRFEFAADEAIHEPAYNIAPTQQVLTVTNDGERRASYMRWGLIPFWAKDAKIGYRMNQCQGRDRSREAQLSHRAAQTAVLDSRRWFLRMAKARRQAETPNADCAETGEPFAFAGLWETWKDPEGELIKSCTIITTAANDYLQPIHDRMPVILPQESESFWLDKDVEDPLALTSVIAPYPDSEMEAFEVSPLVNNTRNKGYEVIDPVARLV